MGTNRSEDAPSLADEVLGGLDSPANFLRRIRFLLILLAIIGIAALIKALT